MIQAMAEGGMAFGGHTFSHRVMSRPDLRGQRAELATGIELIRGLTGQASVPFCYPYGHVHTYNAETQAVLSKLGYSMAFSTVRASVLLALDKPFELPRFDMRDLSPFVSERAGWLVGQANVQPKQGSCG